MLCRDQSSYTRMAVLQTWVYLAGAHAIPLGHWQLVTNIATGGRMVGRAGLGGPLGCLPTPWLLSWWGRRQSGPLQLIVSLLCLLSQGGGAAHHLRRCASKPLPIKGVPLLALPIQPCCLS